MPLPRKRLFAWLAVLLTAGFAALNILAWNHAWAMLHYANGGSRTVKPESQTPLQKVRTLLTGVNVPRPHSPKTPADVPLAFERIRIPAPGGIQLGAWHCPGSNTQALVLLFHGWSMDKASLLPEAAAFHSLGYPCLLVDFRGSGESSCSHTTIGVEEGADVAAAVRYARARFPGVRLVLFGQSMGAAAILRAIQAEGVAPDAIILEAVFDSMLQTARNRFSAMGVPSFPNAELLVFWGGQQFGFNAFRHNPADYARSVACPALFLHGTGDPRATPEESGRVRSAIPHRSTYFVTFPSTSHDDTAIAHPDLWRKTMVQFLETLPSAP
jgi:pimeloyl-ACP methyl ester carboxylesterase